MLLLRGKVREPAPSELAHDWLHKSRHGQVCWDMVVFCVFVLFLCFVVLEIGQTDDPIFFDFGPLDRC